MVGQIQVFSVSIDDDDEDHTDEDYNDEDYDDDVDDVDEPMHQMLDCFSAQYLPFPLIHKRHVHSWSSQVPHCPL